MTPKQDDRPRRWTAEVGWYAAVALAALLFAGLTLRLWQADFRALFRYEGDSLYLASWVKGLRDNGWYLRHDGLGAPWGTDFADFPAADNLHLLGLKLLAHATGDVALSINVFYVLTFPLAAVTAFFALRRLGLAAPPSLVAAVLFALLPYHFWRGQLHLMLSAYYLVPPGLLLGLGLLGGENERFRPLRWKSSTLLYLLIASAGIYYAFFTGVLVAAAGAVGAVRRRSWRPLLAGVLGNILLLAGLLANVSPSLVHWARHGRGEAFERHAAETEIYALKISQLILPIDQHRFEPLALLAARTHFMPCVNENSSAALGVVGAAGFLGLLAWLLLRPAPSDRLPDRLATLNLVAILLGTLGGFGSLVGLLATPSIRAYNRISIFIGFLALALVAWTLDRIGARWATTPARRAGFLAALALLLLGGVWDQTTPAMIPPYVLLKHQFRGDRAFFRAAEKHFPAGALVFQLPVVRCPGAPTVHGMVDYDHLRGYLHSRTLRWSYGSLKGRAGDAWLTALERTPADGLVDLVCLAGFDGLYINRKGYEDGGKSLDAALVRLLGGPALVNADGTLALYDLRGRAAALRSRLGDAGWDAAARAALATPRCSWQGGFSDAEGYPEERYRWCSESGELVVDNPSSLLVRVVLTMRCRTGQPGPATLRIRGLGADQTATVRGAEETPVRLSVVVPPGSHALRFDCDAEPLDAPPDPRRLVFRVDAFVLTVDGLVLGGE